jgi:hypothetical protein
VQDDGTVANPYLMSIVMFAAFTSSHHLASQISVADAPIASPSPVTFCNVVLTTSTSSPSPAFTAMKSEPRGGRDVRHLLRLPTERHAITIDVVST